MRWMSCLCCSRDLLGTERLESASALTRSGVLRAREGTLLGPLAFFVCHSLLIEMLGLVAIFSCHHAALVHVAVVCVCVCVCDCCMYVQYTAHLTNASFSHASTPTSYLSISIGPDSAKTHGLSLYLLRPGPHGSVGAASTRALDHIPECSSMIGLPFRHPGTLPSNHAIYSSPCIHFLLT